MINLSTKQLLDYKFYIDELGKKSTLRNYFKTLLRTLWNESDGFSGKRPLGNSGWQTSLAVDMWKAELFDEGGDPEWEALGLDFDYDVTTFDILIKKCISAL